MIGCLTIKHFPAWALTLIRSSADGGAPSGGRPAASGGLAVSARDLDTPSAPDARPVLPLSRPLVVQEDGYVIALNRSALEAGLEPGMTAARAASLCPDAAIRVRDHAAELCAWEYVTGRVHRITPFLESRPPIAWFAADAHEVLGCAKRLGASVGFAGHRENAHLAALMAGPGEVLRVADEQVEAFLNTFPTALLEGLGFSERTLEGLELIGCDTLGLALRLTRRHLTLAFGKEGGVLHDLLHPDEPKPVGLYRPPPCVRRSFRLRMPCREPADLLPIVARLAERACDGLDSLLTGQVRLILHPEHGRIIHASRVLPHLTARRDTIGRFAERLATDVFEQLKRRGFSGHGRAGEPVVVMDAGGPEIERIDLLLAGLMTADAVQGSLFGEKQRLMGEAIRSVHRRRPGALKRALLRRGAHFHEDRVSWLVWDP